MVGRDLDAPLPAARADDRRGRASRSKTGRSRTRIDARPAWSSTTSSLNVRERRGRRHRRPDGRRAHRVRDERLRPLLRHAASPAQVFKDGKEIDVTHGRRGDRRTASPTSPRTARRYGLILIDDIKREHHAGRPAQASPSAACVDDHEEIAVADELPRRSMNIKAPSVDADRRQALRRQPAEGRARASGCSPTRTC